MFSAYIRSVCTRFDSLLSHQLENAISTNWMTDYRLSTIIKTNRVVKCRPSLVAVLLELTVLPLNDRLQQLKNLVSRQFDIIL